MLEAMFDKLKKKDELKGASRVLAFYHLLRCCGLRIRHGRYAGCNFQYGRNGGVATIDINSRLYLSFSVYVGENEHVEFSVSSRETEDDVTLIHLETSWALSYARDPHRQDPQIEHLAALFRVRGDGEPSSIDALRLRDFLREVSRLTIQHPTADLVAPA